MAVNVFNYGYHFFMTRWLGPASYGVLSSIVAMMLLSGVPALIATSILVKYAAEFSAHAEEGKVHTLYRASVLVLGAFATLLVLLVLPLQGSIAAFLRLDDSSLVVVAAASVALGLTIPAFRGILQGVQDFRRLAISTALEGFAKAVVGVVLVLAGFGLRGAVAGYGMGTLIAIVYTYWSLRQYRTVQLTPIDLPISRLAKATIGIAVGILCVAMLSSVDVILVKHYFSPALAGIFGAVSLAGKVMLFISGFIPPLLLPKVTSHKVKGISTQSLLALSVGTGLLLSGAGLFVVYFAPRLVINVFAGGSYDAAAAVLLPYSAAMALLGTIQILANYFIGMHRYHFTAVLAMGVAVELAAIALWHNSLASVTQIVLATMLAITAALVVLAYFQSQPTERRAS